MRRVCHRHTVRIIDDVLVGLFFFVLVPSFLYFQGALGLGSLEFKYFEAYLALVYFIMLYKIFDWYNDVWIITDDGIIDVHWNIYTGNVSYIGYHSIHGVSIERASFMDSMLWKWDVVLELEWDAENENFILYDANNPDGIVDEIQKQIRNNHHEEEEIEEEIDDRAPFEVLLETLTEMVKEHMQKKGKYHDEEEDEETKRQIELALKRKSTIDLTREE